MLNIQPQRLKAGLTRAEFAQKIGYSTSQAIYFWERGKRRPPADLLPKIAEILNCKIEDLYTETQEGGVSND